MEVFRDMATDAGYRGEEREQVARMLEEQEREAHEQAERAREDARASSAAPSPGREATITRDELVRVVEDALPEGCAESTKVKMRAVAETTDAVAVGWFHCDGTMCPARQAGRHNQGFQEAFDRAMAVRFGREWDEGEDALLPIKPFVVTVSAPSPEAGE